MRQRRSAMHPTDPESILAQDAWLRRIARSLVRDPDLANELVQDAWVAGLERGEERRPWLIGVLRNVGVSRLRSSASQRERARRSAETAPTEHRATDDVVADLELRERVAHELRALEEPYRTALHHRFVSDLSVKEIARRTGVAPSTVSERIARGLARLRQRLDRAYDGDRGAWSALLLPLARPEGLAQVFAGAIAMTTVTKWTLAAVAAGALVLTLSLWPFGEVDPRRSAAVAPADGRMARMGALEGETAELTGPEAAPARVEREPLAGADPAPRTDPGEGGDGPKARVVGTFRLPDGRWAAGADWRISGSPANRDAARMHGLPERWEPRSGTLDASGRIDVTFDAPRAYQIQFSVSAPGCALAQWNWNGLVPDERRDLGEVTLRPATRISGRLVGPDGQPPSGGQWRIHVAEEFERGRPPVELWSQVHEHAVVDPATGAFSVMGVPAGRVSLSAASDRGWFKGPELGVPAAGLTGVEFRLESLVREDASVIVDLDFEAVLGSERPDAARIALVDEGGRRTPGKPYPGQSWSFVFEDVGEGPKRIIVDDPAFEREEREGVRAGDRVRIALRGSATLELVVQNGGDPVELYAVELEMLDVAMMPRITAHAGDVPLEDGRLTGVTPGDYRVFARANGRFAAADALDLGAGETRRVVLELTDGAILRGQARFADGTPAARVRARLVTPAEVDDGPASFVVSEFATGGFPELNRHEIDRAPTDAEGRFALAALGPGRYIVMLGEDRGASTESGVIDVVAGVTPDPLELVVPRAARIRGRIDAPVGLDLSGWRVVPFWPGMGVIFQSRFEPAVVNSEGAFELPSLALGPFELYLLRPGSGMQFERESGGPAGGRLLAQFTLTDGESIERAFPFPGPLPSSITFEVALSGASSDECTLEVTTAGPFRSSEVVRGSAPTLGPLLVDPGERTVVLRGDGWGWIPSDPLTIPEGATLLIPLEVELVPGSVHIEQRGQPSASARCTVRRAGASTVLTTLTTDERGHVELRLAAGTYDLGVSSGAPGDPPRTVRIQWPLADPTVALDGE